MIRQIKAKIARNSRLLRRSSTQRWRIVSFRMLIHGLLEVPLSRPCELQQVRLVIDFDLTGSVDHYPPSFYPARERATD